MYYCIECKTAHKLKQEGEEVFLTGFVIIEGEKLPAGFAAATNKKTRPLFKRTSLSLKP